MKTKKVPFRNDVRLGEKLLDAYRALDDVWHDPRIRPGEFKGDVARLQMGLLEQYEIEQREGHG